MNWLTAPIVAPLLCGTMLIVALMRVTVPIGQPIHGTLLGAVPLGFRERLRLQRANVYLIGVVLMLGTIGGWLRAPLNLVVVLATFVIVSIPVQYTITTEGISRNRVVFRRWAEFAGVHEDRGRFVLRGINGAADFSILLAPAQHAFVNQLLLQTGVSKQPAETGDTKRRAAAAVTGDTGGRKGAVSTGR